MALGIRSFLVLFDAPYCRREFLELAEDCAFNGFHADGSYLASGASKYRHDSHSIIERFRKDRNTLMRAGVLQRTKDHYSKILLYPPLCSKETCNCRTYHVALSTRQRNAQQHWTGAKNLI